MATHETQLLGRLEVAFPERVVTPGLGKQFEAAVKKPWSQTCWTPAGAYVMLETAEEVAEALKIVKQHDAKFAVRTTGHNPNNGFSNLDAPGVVLDIRRLGSISLSSDGTALVGAGCTWGEVYAWLEDKKLSAIGGRDQQVGVAGFLLGGGMGAFPNLQGLGTDGVKNFQVVLADGTITEANPAMNPDLFVALKGGGSNFGIVTRFDLHTYPLIDVQYEINLYNPSDHEAINRATIEVQEKMEADSRIGLFTNFNASFVAVGTLYAGLPAEPASFFSSFRNLGGHMMTAAPKTKGTLLSLAQAMGHAQESKKRAICTVTTKISQDLYEAVYKHWSEKIRDLPEGVVLHYTIQPVGNSAVKIGADRGGNIMGLEYVSQCWWVFTCEWAEDSADSIALKTVETIAQEVQALAQDQSLLLDYLCMSFATVSQKVLRSYGQENGGKMKEAAKKYDPARVFQDLQNNGFLLRNSI